MKIPEMITAGISTARSVVQIAMTSTTTANAARFAYMVFAMPRLACSPGRAEHGEESHEDAPAGEHQAELDRAQVHRERRVPEDGEEAPVVAQRGQGHREQATMLQRA